MMGRTMIVVSWIKEWGEKGLHVGVRIRLQQKLPIAFHGFVGAIRGVDPSIGGHDLEVEHHTGGNETDDGEPFHEAACAAFILFVVHLERRELRCGRTASGEWLGGSLELNGGFRKAGSAAQGLGGGLERNGRSANWSGGCCQSHGGLWSAWGSHGGLEGDGWRGCRWAGWACGGRSGRYWWRGRRRRRTDCRSTWDRGSWCGGRGIGCLERHAHGFLLQRDAGGLLRRLLGLWVVVGHTRWGLKLRCA